MLTEQQLAAIEYRNQNRAERRKGIPRAEYTYDSLGFIYAESGPRERRVGILVRSEAWFEQVDMDANLTSRDYAVAPALAQYISAALSEEIEGDIASLIAEIRRLQPSRK